MIKPVLRIQLVGRGRSKHQSLCVLTNLDLRAGLNIPEPQYCFKLSVPDPGIFVRIRLRDLSFFLLLYYREWKDSINPQCSTTGKPTHLFRTKCASLDSV